MEHKILYYLDKVERALEKEPVMPVTCEIDPSNLCMLNCSFCMFKDYLASNQTLIPFFVYRRLINSLSAIGTKSITFTGGGEPLSHPNIDDMVSLALDSGFEVGLVTNGVLLHRLKNIDKFKFIRVSLDAADASTYLGVKGVNMFKRVTNNIAIALDQNPTVGLSYVVCQKNRNGLEKAQELADDLGVAYIQFKPAWMNGAMYTGYKLPSGERVIETERLVAEDETPCGIASLVGIVGADSNVYYCCQHRGKPHYRVGSLLKEDFETIWAKRPKLRPIISECPQCRYMNYTRTYKDWISKGTLFFKHRNFL